MQPESKYLLVTLADRNFLNQARQLFSSVYWHAGWRGDYMLLAHDIPDKELEWFRNKGILIYNCQPFTTGKVGQEEYPAVVLDKFYLFTPYFRRWEKIIFLDADVIVRASLNSLTLTNGFAASEATDLDLRHEFGISPRHIFVELYREYPLRGPAFNTGVLVFDTGIITDGLFECILSLYRKFGALNRYGEEATLNLAFYKNWIELPTIYNTQGDYMAIKYSISIKKIRAIILHFAIPIKPWMVVSPYEAEWRENLAQAEAMDLTHRPPATKVWTDREIKTYLFLIFWEKFLSPITWTRRLTHKLNWFIGQIGLLVKKISPDLYETIRFKKNTS